MRRGGAPHAAEYALLFRPTWALARWRGFALAVFVGGSSPSR